MNRYADLGHGMPPVRRLGLATRSNTHLLSEDVAFAIERGVNYLNWCGCDDGLSAVVRGLGARRSEVVVATQLQTTDRDGVLRELDHKLAVLGTDVLDVGTLYYVESQAEWERLAGRGGALEGLQAAKDRGLLRAIGLTTHQRPLAARWVRTGLLDMVMARYNAAHRGAEREVFPVTDALGVSVVAFTCLRWRALIRPTPLDPPGFMPPPARECYRFALSNPSVGVALMAPNDRAELDENLALLDDWRALTDEEHKRIEAHGDRVHETAGAFW